MAIRFSARARTPARVSAQAPIRALTLLLVLSACAPYSGFYQAGQTVAQLDVDLTECEVDAVNRVPRNTQVRTTPVRYIPGRVTCTPKGVCTSTRSEFVGGDPYTVDLNAGLRNRVAAQCMASRGYQRVTIPACSPEVSRIAAARPPARLPQLSEGLCAARTGNRGYLFVTTVPG